MSGPTTSSSSRLLTDFRAEVYELLGSSWCRGVHQGFEQARVERALMSIALGEPVDLGAESLGPEECTPLVCRVVNERLKSVQSH
jgi:hypothetical protein